MKADDRETMPHPSGTPGSGPERTPGKFLYPSGSQPLQGYTIKRGVGAGGFGEIYYAVSDAGKEVALKLIQRHLEVELRGIRQCLNLKHPNLVALYDVREDDRGHWWVVMEYIAGQNLQETIANYPQGMPLNQALLWIHGIGGGVGYLHDRGIVHRDLKPANIFCDEGIVKVGDYGLSKFISCSRRSGHTESIGTVHYMAPEVANGRYGKEIDIYALGVILYEMLTGRVPFEGESVGEVLMKHLTALPDVSALNEPYRSIVAQALNKDPQRRFKSVQQMLAQLPQPGLPAGSFGPVVPPVAAPAGAAGSAPSEAPRAAEPVMATVVEEHVAADEEPVWKFFHDHWSRARTSWDQWNPNPGLKLVVLILILMGLATTSGGWVPSLVFCIVCYGIYLAVRAISRVIAPPRYHAAHARPSPYAAHPAASPAGNAASPARPIPVAMGINTRSDRKRWREHAMAELNARSPRQRLTELVGSMVVGAVVALVMTVVAVIVDDYWLHTTLRPEQIAWLATCAIGGTWSVLVAAKFWEGRRSEVGSRRFMLMVVGLGLGMLAWLLAASLYVPMNAPGNLPGYLTVHPWSPYQGFFDASGAPALLAFVAAFGTLFLLVRWWQQADPLRPTRLRLGSVVVSGLAAYVVGWLGVFPHPWLILMACMISVSVQMSSPWIAPPER